MFTAQVALTLLLMGAIPLLVRVVDTSSVVIAVVRLTFGAGLTLAFFGRKLSLSAFRKNRLEAGVLVFIGVLFGAHWLTYFEAIQRSSATLGVLALSTYGVHVTWMGALFSQRKPSRKDLASVVVAALGAWLCLPTPQEQPEAFVGFLFGLVSGLFYAALPLLHQRVAHLGHATRGSAQFAFAWLLLLPLAPSQDWTLSTRDIWILVVLGVLCTFVAHNLWIAITTKVKPSTSGLLYYLVLPVTMVLETAFVGHPPSLAQVAGAVLIVGGNATVLLGMRNTSAAASNSLSRTDAPTKLEP